MNIKFLTILSLIFMFLSCKNIDNNTDIVEHKEESNKIKEKDLSKLDYIEFALDSRTKKVIEEANWVQYNQLQDVITNVKKGDLSFFDDNDEAINTLLKDLKNKVPAAVRYPPTLARITALETKLYKLESLSNLITTSKQELKDSIKEFLEAFSNLNLQMNKKLEKDSRIIEKP